MKKNCEDAWTQTYFNCEHEWKQRFIERWDNGIGSNAVRRFLGMGVFGFYCIKCLEEKDGEDKVI